MRLTVNVRMVRGGAEEVAKDMWGGGGGGGSMQKQPDLERNHRER